MKQIRTILLALVCVLCACNPNAPTRRYSLNEFNTVYVRTYGHCYDSVPMAVVSLDFYTPDLYLDSAERMQGTGYNLYLSDVFVPDSLLENGTYKSDTSALAFTFLPGKSFEGTPTGCYLLTVEEGSLTNIQLIDSGTMVVKDTLGGLKDIQLTYYTHSNTSYFSNRQRYTSHFQGTLTPRR